MALQPLEENGLTPSYPRSQESGGCFKPLPPGGEPAPLRRGVWGEAFSRSFYVPENVNREKIEANYKDGILTVSLPKQEEEKNKITRKIEIA